MANPYREDIDRLQAIIKQQTSNIRFHKNERRRLVNQARKPDCIGAWTLRHQAAEEQREAVVHLRPEARHALLAYALLRGRSYRRIEPASKNRPAVWKIQRYLPEEKTRNENGETKPPIPKRVIETWLSGGCMTLQECLEAHGLLDTDQAA